ncbi:hypothetical protein QBC35DRAFT_492222 [Podospora australis]|uniref:Uncharacterized protein n=1 Tax=Podospora australis TaxID=1536484 RepID=A0AAN6WX13_9PEZI|nr:hypothetical protein QBC35DRAFT_492222 [Podospora australis]
MMQWSATGLTSISVWKVGGLNEWHGFKLCFPNEASNLEEKTSDYSYQRCELLRSCDRDFTCQFQSRKERSVILVAEQFPLLPRITVQLSFPCNCNLRQLRQIERVPIISLPIWPHCRELAILVQAILRKRLRNNWLIITAFLGILFRHLMICNRLPTSPKASAIPRPSRGPRGPHHTQTHFQSRYSRWRSRGYRMRRETSVSSIPDQSHRGVPKRQTPTFTSQST